MPHRGRLNVLVLLPYLSSYQYRPTDTYQYRPTSYAPPILLPIQTYRLMLLPSLSSCQYIPAVLCACYAPVRYRAIEQCLWSYACGDAPQRPRTPSLPILLPIQIYRHTLCPKGP
eukprot:482219-Rhodomonas_salina.2